MRRLIIPILVGMVSLSACGTPDITVSTEPVPEISLSTEITVIERDPCWDLLEKEIKIYLDINMTRGKENVYEQARKCTDPWVFLDIQWAIETKDRFILEEYLKN